MMNNNLFRPFTVLSVLFLLFFVFLSFNNVSGYSASEDSILLEQVKTLTFYRGKWTSSRRTSPVPQLNCIGGSARGQFEPSVVQCYNMGKGDSDEIQWKCESDMDNAYRFGQVTVSCEGYTNPNDPYVLKGSCGLEYSLEYTEEGREKQQRSNSYNQQYSYNSYGAYQSSNSTVGSLFVFGILIFIFFCIWKMCTSPTYYATPVAPGAPGYGMGGPGYGMGGPGYYGGVPPVVVNPSGGGDYWSGFMTGGLLGNMFARPRWWGGGYGYAPSYGYAPTFSGPSTGFAPSTSAPTSSGTRTATGYGGTRNR